MLSGTLNTAAASPQSCMIGDAWCVTAMKVGRHVQRRTAIRLAEHEQQALVATIALGSEVRSEIRRNTIEHRLSAR